MRIEKESGLFFSPSIQLEKEVSTQVLLEDSPLLEELELPSDGGVGEVGRGGGSQYSANVRDRLCLRGDACFCPWRWWPEWAL